MTEIILNEKMWVENRLKERSLGNNTGDTLRRVAKYYAAQGYTENEIVAKVESFVEKCDNTISIVKMQKFIHDVVKSAMKSNLIDIDSINITNAEMEMIHSLDGSMQERVMFTLLCLAKYGDAVRPTNDGWVNNESKQIFKLANVVMTTMRQSLLIHNLMTKGYVSFSKAPDNVNIKVNIINNDSDVALRIVDFRNLGMQYMRYFGGKYMECKECGIVIRRTTNNQKYCKACAKLINVQKSSAN